MLQSRAVLRGVFHWLSWMASSSGGGGADEELFADAGNGPERFNLETGARTLKHRLPQGASRTICAAASASLGCLACIADKSLLCFFLPGSPHCSARVPLGEEPTACSVGPSGRTVVLSTRSAITCYASESSALLWRRSLPLRGTSCLLVNDCAGVALVGGHGGDISSISYTDGREVLHWRSHSLAVSSIDCDGYVLVSCGLDRLLNVHALQGASGALLASVRLSRPLRAIALAPASSHAIVGDAGGSLMSVPLHGHNGRADVAVQEAPGAHDRSNAHNGPVTSISVSSLSGIVASASSSEDCVRLWRLSLGTEMPFAPIRDIKLGSTGVHMASIVSRAASGSGNVPSWPSKLAAIERSQEEELDGEVADALEPGKVLVSCKQDLDDEPLVDRAASMYERLATADDGEDSNLCPESESLSLQKRYAALYNAALNLVEEYQ